MNLSILIIVITGLISYMAFQNPEIKLKYMFNAYKIHHRKEWVRIVSHGFLHANWEHLIVNMLTLYFFGRKLEQIFIMIHGRSTGILLFVIIYFGGIIVSSLMSLQKHKDNEWYNALGASGAVAAVLFASIFYDPMGKIYLMFAIPIPGFLFGIAYLGYSYYMSKNSNDNIGHDAHFSGAIFGILFALVIDPNMFAAFSQ